MADNNSYYPESLDIFVFVFLYVAFVKRVRVRKGNKLASSIGLKIPPLGIPQEVFGYYNKIYSIEQKGFDPLGTNTTIRIKK